MLLNFSSSGSWVYDKYKYSTVEELHEVMQKLNADRKRMDEIEAKLKQR